MALEFKDRVGDTSTTTGAGTLTLAGAPPTGYRDFTAHTTGATVRYGVTSADSTEWEVGEGVWTASGATLTRVTVYASSNAGALVNFSAGTKTVYEVMTAASVTAYVGCKATNNGTQAISNTTSTAVLFGGEDWDSDAIHDTSTDTSRFTVPTGRGGRWQFSWGLQFAANATGQRIAWLRKNGGTDSNNVHGSGDRKTGHGTHPATLGKVTVVDLAAGDYVELFVYQDSGSALNLGAPTGGTTNAEVSVLEARFLG